MVKEFLDEFFDKHLPKIEREDLIGETFENESENIGHFAEKEIPSLENCSQNSFHSFEEEPLMKEKDVKEGHGLSEEFEIQGTGPEAEIQEKNPPLSFSEKSFEYEAQERETPLEIPFPADLEIFKGGIEVEDDTDADVVAKPETVAQVTKMFNEFLSGGDFLLPSESEALNGENNCESRVKSEEPDCEEEINFGSEDRNVYDDENDENYSSSSSDEDKRFRCHKCSYKSISRSNLIRHKLTHGERKVFKCLECAYATNCASYLRKHKKKHLVKKYKCLTCNYSNNNLHRMRQHEMTHVDVKYLEPLEHEGQDTKNSCKHSNEEASKGLKLFTCDICNFKTKSKSSLKNHCLTHSDVKKFKCSQCEYATNKMSNLNRHELLHTDAVKYKCSKCDYETKGLAYFRRHEKTHSNIKKYTCSQCDYGTNNICNLKRHKSKHAESKDLMCSRCEYRTNCLSYLKRHILTHSDKKKFSCSSCSYGTNNKSHLRDHLRTHLV